MDKHLLCAVLAALFLAFSPRAAEQVAEKTDKAAPAKAAEEPVAAPASDAVHPLEANYEDETNPFVAANWEQYGFGYKQLVLHRFMAYAKGHRTGPLVPFGRKRTGDAEVDAARDRLKEDRK